MIPTVFAGLTCTAARFEIPGVESFSEALLVHPTGGAVAAFSSSALSYHSGSRALWRKPSCARSTTTRDIDPR
jgi:hypothetical protein